MTARIRKLEPHEDDTLAAALAALDRPAVAADLFLSDPRCHAFVAFDATDRSGSPTATRCFGPKGSGWWCCSDSR